jgi:hypothetical protein
LLYPGGIFSWINFDNLYIKKVVILAVIYVLSST